MTSFFRFSAQADVQAATLSIFDVVGLWGVQAADFRTALAAVTAPQINLEINSPGGDVFAGIAIYNMLRQSGKTIDAKVLGLAASAAAIILMSGDSITVPSNGFVMIHRASTVADGHADALREGAAALDKIDMAQTLIFSGRTGISENRVRELLAAETWLNGSEAVSMGFATSVSEEVQAETAFATAHAKLPTRVVAALKAPTFNSSSAHRPSVRAPTTSDIWANLAARIKLTTGEGAAFTTAFNGVFEIAQRTGSSLDTVGDLFNKLAAAGKLVGLSNAEALALTETIAQATQLSGTSADSANAAITQLVQGLQSGALRGDELNSVLEQTPRLAKALADGLGVTTGELRKLGEAGSLTSTQVINALKGQGAALRAEFDQLPQTIGRALTNLSSGWTQYVGEVDKATGASSTIAGVINALAKNLDTVVTVLLGAGKAAVAFQAIRLAQTFLGLGVAAKVATAETVAFAAAQAAANGAAATSAAGVGRLASVMGTLKLGALVAVAVNIKSIGEAIGEQVAKWRGYGDVIRDAEGRMRAQEAAARSLAEANAALAQKAQIAADKALGLGVEAQALVGTFEKARQAGDTVADSLDKVSKALDLSNVQGIEAAGAALDALTERSKITGDQMREVLSAALKTEDLGKFQTEAAAAFDGSEIGARRLAAAIDAIGDESLRRVGLSVQELKTGIGAATASAINDVDALDKTFDRLGATGPEVGNALAQALDKATAAASTERALKAVIERYEELGRSGRLSGEQVAAGLEKAREKIDSLLPGVGSLREALHDFGLRSSEEMQATATRFKESWEIISNSVTTSLDDKIEAFEKYAAAAIAANKGVETSEISVQREMLRTRQIAAQGVAPSNGAPLRPQRTPAPSPSGQKQATQQGGRNADGSYQRNEDSLGIIGPNQVVKSNLGDTREERLAGQNAVDNRLMFQLRDKLENGSLDAGDIGGLETVVASLRQNAIQNAQVDRHSAGFIGLDGRRDDLAWQSVGKQFEQAVSRLKRPTKADAPSAAPVAGGSSHTVMIDLGGGRRGTFNMASEGDASGIAGLLSQLGNAKAVS